MNILACDPAMKFGWATNCIGSGVWDLKPLRDQSRDWRLVNLRGKLDDLLAQDPHIEIVVFEAARNAAPNMQGALSVQNELQGVLKLWCLDHDINYRGYSPKEIKKHAVLNGNASKQLMIDAATEYFDQIKIIDDNHADALWLLDLIMMELHVEGIENVK